MDQQSILTRPQSIRYTLARKACRFTSIAWSPNEKLLVTSCSDATLRIWNTDNGKHERSLEGHFGVVTSASWSPDGKYIASASQDGTVREWDWKAETSTVVIDRRTFVTSVAWSYDGTKHACGCSDHSICLWNTRTKSIDATFEHGAPVESITWSPDNSHLASGARDGTVRIWDVRTARLERTLGEHSKPVASVAWNHDRKWLASGAEDKLVRIWSPTADALPRNVTQHHAPVTDVAWSPDGTRLAIGAENGIVSILEVNTDKLLRVLEGHLRRVTGVAWSIDGKRVASCSEDGTIRIWDVDADRLLHIIEGHSRAVVAVAWSDDRERVAAIGESGTVRVWNPITAELLKTMEGQSRSASSIAWSPNRQELVSGAWKNTARVWTPEETKALLQDTLKGHTGPICSLAWSPNGKTIATGSFDNTVRLWRKLDDAYTLFQVLEQHTEKVTTLAWSAQTPYLASGSSDSTICIWDVLSQSKPIRLTYPKNAAVTCIAWSPDGTRVASGATDNTVRIWSGTSGQLLRVLEGHLNPIVTIAWYQDDHLLVTSSTDNIIKWWDIDTGECIQDDRLALPNYRLLCVFFDKEIHSAQVLNSTSVGDPDLQTGTIQFNPTANSFETQNLIQSAKVVLIGESSVGKSALAMRLAENRFENHQPTTQGMRVWRLPRGRMPSTENTPPHERREVILWDFGGQSDYGLIHQLFIHDTTVALLLLDPTRDSHFQYIKEWVVRLEKQVGGRRMTKFLVGARADLINNDSVDRARIHEIIESMEMAGYYLTSARDETGIVDLLKGIDETLDWDALVRTTRPKLFQIVRDCVTSHQEKGEVVLIESQLSEELTRLVPEGVEPSSLQAVIDQLSRQGVVASIRMSDGKCVLILQIEYVEAYAGSLIRLAREAERLRGVPALDISELAKRNIFPGLKAIAPLLGDDQRKVLECVIELMLEHGLCIRHQRLLIFPTLFPNESKGPTHEDCRPVSLYYDFTGAIDNIYSSLVAQLAVSDRFGRVRLWKGRAELALSDKGICAINRTDRPGGWSQLDLFFSSDIDNETRKLFTVFVDEHLRESGVNVRDVLEITCTCGHHIANEILRQRIENNCVDVACPICETRWEVGHDAAGVRDTTSHLDLNDALIALKQNIQRNVRLASYDTKEDINNIKRAAPSREGHLRDTRFLHLSDLHLKDDTDITQIVYSLVADLNDEEKGFGGKQLDYVLLSGDLTNAATGMEFVRVYEFLSDLLERLNLSAERCVIVPGNHDQSWDSEPAPYRWIPKRRISSEPQEGAFHQEGEVYAIRDEEAYGLRFKAFTDFYKSFTQRDYSLDFKEQFSCHLYEAKAIQLVTFNSAWQVDEYFQDRSSIHPGAIARALDKANKDISDAKNGRRLDPNSRILRIAIWHHPLTNPEDNNDGVFGQLSTADFRIALHGHCHREMSQRMKPLLANEINVVGGGSLTAEATDRPESTPRHYSLLEISPNNSRIRVHTRHQERQGSPWKPWPMYRSNENPETFLSYYDIHL